MQSRKREPDEAPFSFHRSATPLAAASSARRLPAAAGALPAAAPACCAASTSASAKCVRARSTSASVSDESSTASAAERQRPRPASPARARSRRCRSRARGTERARPTAMHRRLCVGRRDAASLFDLAEVEQELGELHRPRAGVARHACRREQLVEALRVRCGRGLLDAPRETSSVHRRAEPQTCRAPARCRDRRTDLVHGRADCAHRRTSAGERRSAPSTAVRFASLIRSGADSSIARALSDAAARSASSRR